MVDELEAQLQQLSPEEREKLEAAAREFAQLSPEDQAVRKRQEVEESLVNQVGQLIVALRRGDIKPAEGQEAAASIRQLLAQLTADEQLGEMRHGLAAFLEAAAAVLEGKEWPAVPEAYADVVAQIESQSKTT